MSKIHVEVSEIIEAPAAQVYAILADFEVAHPAILPKPYFAETAVETGGHGAGTIYNLRMNVYGIESHYRMSVTEPEPGRKLVETDLNGQVVTTMHVDPLGDQRCRLTFASDFTASRGFMGFMERLTMPGITRRIYKQEMQILADYVRNQNKVAPGTA